MDEPLIGWRAWRWNWIVEPERRGRDLFTGTTSYNENAYVPDPEREIWLVRTLEATPRRPKQRKIGMWFGPLNASQRFNWGRSGPIHFGCAHGHQQPEEKCACGLYAYPALGDLCRRAGLVQGAVRAWGRIIVHGDKGFRAEWMQPILVLRGGHKEASAEAAKRWGVPLVAPKNAELVAGEHGITLARRRTGAEGPK